MTKKILALVIAALACAPAAVRAQEDPQGSWALYRMFPAGWRNSEPPVKTVRVTVGPLEKGLRWWSMEIAPSKGDPFKVFVLSQGAPARKGSKLGAIARYRLRDVPGRTLEFVNAENGGPLLPLFDFRNHLVPRDVARVEHVDGFAQTVEMLGHVLLLDDSGKGAAFEPLEGKLATLGINPGLLVATSRNVKNGVPGRTDDPKKDYEYVRLVREDYDRMIEAGFNMFRGDAEQTGWIVDRPVYFLMDGSAIVYPLDLYRSNYFGAVQYFDEPSVHLRWDNVANAMARRPVDLARLLETRLRAEYREKMDRLASGLLKAEVELGDMQLVQRDVPIWETFIQTCWYELKGGGSGVVQECRYDLEKTRKLWKRITKTDLRPTVRDMLLYDIGHMRGAARAFGKEWGIAIYGQADPAISPEAVKLAYDLGARFVWFWTSDHNHHLPFGEQLLLARTLTKHAAEHPRRPRSELVRAARVAVAVADGYELGMDVMMWTWPKFGMDVPTAHGGSYGDILRDGILHSVRLSREGVPFDIVIDDENLPRAGYETIIRISKER